MLRISFFIFHLLSLQSLFAQNIAKKPLLHAHSHNDYQHDQPLVGALALGCTSMEIDVFAHKDDLKIAHIKFALNIRGNFENMYLKPLIEILETRKYIYKDIPLVLMIDFKTNGDSTLPLLLEEISPYKQYFSYYDKNEDSVILKDLQLVISGRGFSYEQVENLDSIFVFVDGSVRSCDTEYPAKLVPRGSARYGSIFSWKGKGEIPDEELAKLRTMVNEAKKCNKKLRFYAMPANEKIWKVFLDEGVHWINIDNLIRYYSFIENKENY